MQMRDPRPARSRHGRHAHHAGLAAEDVAERAYADRGGTVLARRWRCRDGEIDLVVAFGDLLAFVEVKHCTRPGPDSPVPPRQWARVAAAASRWLSESADPPRACRFDAALVGACGALTVVEHAHIPGLA